MITSYLLIYFGGLKVEAGLVDVAEAAAGAVEKAL